MEDILKREFGAEIKTNVTDEQMIQSLTGMGVSGVLAEALAELVDGIVQGRVKNLEPRSAANTTSTTYRAFAREVFKPAIEAAVAGAAAQQSTEA